MRSLRWMSSMKATYLLQQENNGLLSWAVPHLEINLTQIKSNEIKLVFSPSHILPPQKKENIVWWRAYRILPDKLFLTPCLDSNSTTEFKPDMLSAVSTINIIWRRGTMYGELCMHTCAERMTSLGKDDLIIITYRSGEGGRIMGHIMLHSF